MDLNDIKTKKEIKVYLEEVDVSGIAMTSGAGACSLMNEPFLLKSKDKEVTLTKEEIAILEEIGEYEIITKNKKEDDEMDEKVLKEKENKIAELEKKLAISDSQKAISTFNFEKELNDAISEAVASLDETNREIILKGFSFIEDRKTEELEKALEEKKVEDNPLKKELDDESGHDAEVKIEDETFFDKVKKAMDERNKKENK